MTDKLEYLDNPQLVQQIKDKLGEIAWPSQYRNASVELKDRLGKTDWPMHYGDISIRLRNGKPSLLKILVTIPLD